MILRRMGRFLWGMLIGLTTLMLTGVSMMAVVIYKIPYGVPLAILIGCVGSGVLYLLTLWSYDAENEESSEEDDGRAEEGSQESSTAPSTVGDVGEHRKGTPSTIG